MTKINRAQLRQLILKEAGLLNELEDQQSDAIYNEDEIKRMINRELTIAGLGFGSENSPGHPNSNYRAIAELERRIEQIELAVLNMAPSELDDDPSARRRARATGMTSRPQ